LDAGDGPGRGGLEAGHGEVLVGVGHVDEVVRDPGPLLERGLGRADVHAPVHLHGVDGHDLHVTQLPGQGKGNGRLARRRRAHQGQVPGAVWSAQPTVTGMRTRWRGRAVISMSSPDRWWGAAPVTRTEAKPPAAG